MSVIRFQGSSDLHMWAALLLFATFAATSLAPTRNLAPQEPEGNWLERVLKGAAALKVPAVSVDGALRVEAAARLSDPATSKKLRSLAKDQYGEVYGLIEGAVGEAESRLAKKSQGYAIAMRTIIVSHDFPMAPDVIEQAERTSADELWAALIAPIEEVQASRLVEDPHGFEFKKTAGLGKVGSPTGARISIYTRHRYHAWKTPIAPPGDDPADFARTLYRKESIHSTVVLVFELSREPGRRIDRGSPSLRAEVVPLKFTFTDVDGTPRYVVSTVDEGDQP